MKYLALYDKSLPAPRLSLPFENSLMSVVQDFLLNWGSEGKGWLIIFFHLVYHEESHFSASDYKPGINMLVPKK